MKFNKKQKGIFIQKCTLCLLSYIFSYNVFSATFMQPETILDENGEVSNFLPYNTNANGTMYIINEQKLWRLNANGKQLREEFKLPFPFQIAFYFKDDIYLLGRDNNSNWAVLWKYNLINKALHKIKDLCATGGSCEVQRNQKILGDTLLFNVIWARTGDGLYKGGEESYLWRTDGTINGTYSLKSPTDDGIQQLEVWDKHWEILDDKVLISSGGQLLVSNESLNSTKFLHENFDFGYNFFGKTSAQLNHFLYFEGRDDSGRWLWKTDGTRENTKKVKLIVPALQENSCYWINDAFVGYNDALYILKNSSCGFSLWTSDGTEVGTIKIKEIFYSKKYVERIRLVSKPIVVNNKIQFLMDYIDESGKQFTEIWVSDGTDSGTNIISNLSGETIYDCYIENTHFIVTRIGVGYFDVHDDFFLWRSEGTANSTKLIMDNRTYPKLKVVHGGIALSENRLLINATEYNSDATVLMQILTLDNVPFNGAPNSVDEKIQAEEFDFGASANQDEEEENLGKAFRLWQGVDIQQSPNSGYNVGWTRPGETLDYTIDIPTDGNYSFTARVASPYGSGTFKVLFEDQDKTGKVLIPNTGGWDTWTELTSNEFFLKAGTHQMIIVMEDADVSNSIANFDWLKINSHNSYKDKPFGVNQRIEAEFFDLGGEGIAYHDAEADNLGGDFRLDTGVDIQNTNNAGFNIGWTRSNEWMQYSINIPDDSVNHVIKVRLASPYGGGTFHFELDNEPLTEQITVPKTGGWDEWQTIKTSTLHLGPGLHKLKLVMDKVDASNSIANFDWLRISSW